LGHPVNSSDLRWFKDYIMLICGWFAVICGFQADRLDMVWIVQLCRLTFLNGLYGSLNEVICQCYSWYRRGTNFTKLCNECNILSSVASYCRDSAELCSRTLMSTLPILWRQSLLILFWLIAFVFFPLKFYDASEKSCYLFLPLKSLSDIYSAALTSPVYIITVCCCFRLAAWLCLAVPSIQHTEVNLHMLPSKSVDFYACTGNRCSRGIMFSACPSVNVCVRAYSVRLSGHVSCQHDILQTSGRNFTKLWLMM